MTDIFDSLNPYQNMEFVSGKTADEALQNLKKLRTPVNIVSFVSHAGRLYIFLKGDIRKTHLIRKGLNND